LEEQPGSFLDVVLRLKKHAIIRAGVVVNRGAPDYVILVGNSAVMKNYTKLEFVIS
jgi:acetyltransferase-like isoleucine patch superfamily enzyme